MKKFICIFLVVLLTASNVLYYSVSVRAEYEPDDDFFAFMVEYVKQRNIVSRGKDIYDQYTKSGVSSETAWELVKQNLGNIYTDSQAAMTAVKRTYKNLTDAERWKLIDFYNQVDVSVNPTFTLDASLFYELSLDIFGNSIINDYTYTVPSFPSGSDSGVNTASFAYTPISKSIFRDSVLIPFYASRFPYADIPTPAQINSVLSCKYVELYYLETYTDYSSYYYNTYSYGAFGSNSPNFLYLRTSPYLDFTQYTIDGYSYLAGVKYQYESNRDDTFRSELYGMHYFLDRKIVQLVSLNLAGKYYIVPDSYSIDTVQNIINNNTTNNINKDYNINYMPYTKNINNSYDMPSDENWLQIFKDILMNRPVTTINITINPEPTPEPTPTPDSTPKPEQPSDPVEVEIDFSEINEALEKIIVNQGKTIESVNDMNYKVNNSLNDMNYKVNSSLSDVDNSLRLLRADTAESFASLENLIRDKFSIFDDMQEALERLFILLLIVTTVGVSIFILWLFYSVICIFF